MDMTISGRTIKGVSLVESEFFGQPKGDTPEAKAAAKLDALVLTDEAGKHYRVSKQGLYNQDKAYQRRDTEVVIDGKTYKTLHNVNREDTLGEKITGPIGRFFSAVGFHAEMSALWVVARAQDLMMGLASR